MHCQPGILTSPKILKNKIQITQNKCIRYCLQLDKMTHISKNEFETLNWLPVKDRFNQSINSIVFKYFTKQCPSYLNEVFELACPNNLRTRNSYLKLICPFRRTDMGQNALSFIGPSKWNKTQEVLKKTNRINTLILSNTLLSLKLLLTPFLLFLLSKFF